MFQPDRRIQKREQQTPEKSPLTPGRALLLAGLLLGGLKTINGDRNNSDESMTEEMTPLDSGQVQDDLRRVRAAEKLLESLAQTAEQDTGEAQEVAEKTFDFTQMGITRDLLTEVPTIEDIDLSDQNNMRDFVNVNRLNNKPELKESFENFLDNLHVEVDSASVHIYSDANQDIDVTVTIEKTEIPDVGEIHNLVISASGATSIGSASTVDGGGFDVPAAQKAIRQTVQSIIIAELLQQQKVQP